jgi:hypothetical protein
MRRTAEGRHTTEGTMTGSKGTRVATLLDEGVSRTGDEERLAHLVLRPDWPIALCGANVSDNLGTRAPAMDRCVDCLRIAATRGLGRPGWEAGS